jgi:hypothetical protein
MSLPLDFEKEKWGIGDEKGRDVALQLEKEVNDAMRSTLGADTYHPLDLTSNSNMIKRDLSIPSANLLARETNYCLCQRYLALWTEVTVNIYYMQSHKEKSGPFGAGVNNSKYFGARLSAGDGRGNKLEKFKSFNVDGYIKGKNGVTFDNSEQSIIIITDDFLQRVSLESTSLNPLGKCKHDFIGEIHSVQPWSFEQDRLTSDDYEDAFAKGICIQYGEDLKVAYFSAPPLYSITDSKASLIDIDLAPSIEDLRLDSLKIKNNFTLPPPLPVIESSAKISLSYVFTHSSEMRELLEDSEGKRIYTHPQFKYIVIISYGKHKNVTVAAYSGNNLPFEKKKRWVLDNCSEIYSITHEYPVMKSIFRESPIYPGGMLLVSSPMESIYLLTFGKNKVNCKMEKIITLPSGIRKINKIVATENFKFIMINANGGQMVVWAKMNDGTYGLIYLDDDPTFSKQNIFEFSKDLRYIYAIYNDKIRRIIFEP